MKNSLLFIPDISGFTHFVQNTEIEHSQHVIAELLEIIISANELQLELAEIEGDALFFYKENSIPSQEALFAQAEKIFTAFYSHLKRFETQRICPCNACSRAINLNLKIVVHAGEIQFMNVNENRKPFGASVIEAHRLLKNNIPSDNYFLLSNSLAKKIKLKANFEHPLFKFQESSEEYDGKKIEFVSGLLNKQALKLNFEDTREIITFDTLPDIQIEKEFPITAPQVYEYISNFKYRHFWVQGPEIQFNENEINRVGSEHLCVINENKLNFTTVTKKAKNNELVYGELTYDTPFDAVYQFYIVRPSKENNCLVTSELYFESNSAIKKFFLSILAKTKLKSTNRKTLNQLYNFVTSQSPVS